MKGKNLKLIIVVLVLILVGMTAFLYLSRDKKIAFDEKAVLEATAQIVENDLE